MSARLTCDSDLMNISLILKPVIMQLWWIFPIIVVVAILKSAWFKGVFGETIVRLSAKYILAEPG